MPDPFLNQLDFNKDYESCLDLGKFYNVTIDQKDSYVFIYLKNQSGQKMTARIDCKNYPQSWPKVTFLDPVTEKPSENPLFWPRGIAKIKGPGGSGLCIAGTATYARHHPQFGLTKERLANLVELIILCCRGEAQKLRRIPQR